MEITLAQFARIEHCLPPQRGYVSFGLHPLQKTAVKVEIELESKS